MDRTLFDEPIVEFDEEADAPNPIDAALDRDVRANRASADTPIARVDIAHLPVDELDNMLHAIRERRMERTRLAMEISRTKLEAATLAERQKFDRQYAKVKAAYDKLAAMEQKCEDEMRKFRIMQLTMED